MHTHTLSNTLTHTFNAKYALKKNEEKLNTHSSSNNRTTTATTYDESSI